MFVWWVQVKLMATQKLIPLVFLSLLTMFSHGAPADEHFPRCSQRSEATERLASQHHEKRIAWAVDSYGYLVEIFSSGDGSTWTILVTSVFGVSCVASFGQNLSLDVELLGVKS
jgi:hypothetical protein